MDYTLLRQFTLQAEQSLLHAQAGLMIVRRRRRRRRSRQRSCWVRPWLSAERRLQFGHYGRLLAELRLVGQQSFFNLLCKLLTDWCFIGRLPCRSTPSSRTTASGILRWHDDVCVHQWRRSVLKVGGQTFFSMGGNF